MGVRSEGNGHGNNWKLLIGLSVLCAVVVFLGGFLHRRALESAIADRQAKSVAFVNTKVAAAAKQADLSGPMKDAEAARFTKQLDVPAGTDLRLFSNAGVPLYASPGLAPFPADTEGIQTAAAGDQGRVIDGSDLRVYTPVDGKGAKPVAVAAVVSNYTQLRDDAAGPLDAIRLPVVALGIVLLIAGLLLMVQRTKGSAPAKVPAAPSGKARKTARPKASSSSKGRVTGFDPVPVTVGRPFEPMDEEPVDAVAQVVAEDPAAEPEPVAEPKTFFGLRLGTKQKETAAPQETVVPADSAAPAPAKAKRSLFGRKDAAVDAPVDVEPQNDKAASALDREVAIRQALEDQLEQLRTRIHMQEVESAKATRELTAQLEAANRRAEEAEARTSDAGVPVAATAPVPAPTTAPDDATVRLQQLERELTEARSATTDAVSRAEALQRQLDQAQAAPPAPAADPAAEAKVAEAMAQLTDAQQRATAAEQRASAAEQRAASVESVRDELEVRVAQLGTKASDLEHRATELEASLNEANAGGDAVRAEIATLTAALAAANARVTELESAPAAPAHHEDDQAEIARLRSELASHMERSKAAEDRVQSLEADVLAAQRGVPELQDDASRMGEASWAPEPEASVRSESKVSVQSELEASVDSEPDASRQPEPEASMHIEPDASRQPEPEASMHIEPDASRQPDPEASVHIEPDASRQPEPDASRQSEPEAVNEVSVVSRFALDQDEISTEVVDPAPAADTRRAEPATPTPLASRVDAMDQGEHEQRALEPEAHEPEVHEPEVHEPEVHEPEVHESEVHEPEVHEPEVHESEVHESEVHEPEEHEPEVQAPEVQAPEVQAPHVQPEGHEPEAQGRPVADEPQKHYGAVPLPQTEQAATSAPQAMQPAVEPSRAATNGSDPAQPEAHEAAPVEAEAQQALRAAESSAPTETEPVTAVEWHAPAATPSAAVTSSASNGNGIPPAPSDDARYDDIWTAAFAPPEPKVAQHTEPHLADGHTEPNQPQPIGVAAEPNQPQPNGATSEGEDASDVSPDDQPSPPEDEISAEDDMWSLRARLADAALRKQLPHEID